MNLNPRFNNGKVEVNCRCFATSVLKTPDELEADNERIMNGDEPTTESVNEVKDMPENFKGWIDKNADRIAAAEKRGTLPYFIKDNKGYVVKVNSTVLKSDNTVVVRESNAPHSIVDIVKNISDNMTDKELTDLFVEFCNKNPNLFNGKLNGVQITKYRNEYMSIEREHRLGAGDYIKERGQTLNITNVTEQGTNFNPYIELKNALLKIKNGGELTFKEEYALECSWHEIKHAGAKGWKDAASRNIRPKTGLSKKDVMETVNQFVARNTYDDFITSLGGKAVNKEAILARGYGYRTEVENFNKMLDFLKIDKVKAASKLDEIVTGSHYEDVWKETAEWIKKETGVSGTDINKAFNHLKDSDSRFNKTLLSLKISK
jgi:hypothetical protein